MKIDFIVISGRTLDTEPCVALVSDNASYVFNCPEQTQRVFMSNKWKLNKIKQFFITDLSSSSIAGIPGLLLTTFKGNKPSLGFNAPAKFSEIHKHQLINYFDNMDSFPDIRNDIYSDDIVTVTPFELESSIAYVMKVCNEPGKFNVTQAKQLGLKPGPIFKKLQNGESVTLDDGITVIQPSMCVGPSIPGPKILILNCNTMQDLQSFMKLTKKIDENEPKIILDQYEIIVHLTKPEIMINNEYQWLFNDKNYENTKQICFFGNEKIVFGDISTLYSSITGRNLVSHSFTKKIGKAIEGELGMIYSLIPSNNRKLNPAPQFQDIISEGSEFPSIQSFAITFLGTGCNNPTKLRNVAGILLHFQEGFAILDCGEGFLGQLRRKYGRENCEYILKNLHFVFISHFHGDHHYGLQNVLETRDRLTNKRIPLMADKVVIDDIKCRGEYNVDFLDRNTTTYKINNIAEIQAIPVIHCDGSHGCLVTIYEKDGKNTWKVAYSGDHTTEDDFADKVQNCDILIHEATFDNNMENEAQERCHSTINQAIETGHKVNAKFIVLTHISARYKFFDNSILEGFTNVMFAFDYLSFKYEDLANQCDICKRAFTEIANKNRDEER